MYLMPPEVLEVYAFKEMDYILIREYALPVELMMKNAGLILANLCVDNAGQKA